jgi:hypothetical protein
MRPSRPVLFTRLSSLLLLRTGPYWQLPRSWMPIHGAANKSSSVVLVVTPNGDGKPDLVLVNGADGGSPGISVLLNRGAPRFSMSKYRVLITRSISITFVSYPNPRAT